MNLKVLILILNLLILPTLAFSREKNVIIGFKQKPSLSELTMVHKAKGTIKRTFQRIPAVAASIPEEKIEQLRKNSNIAYIEENAIYTAAAGTSNDKEYNNSWGVYHIFADAAHAKGNKGRGIKVAVLDTGINYTHEDLNGNYKGGYDFVFNDNDPFDDSFNSHGTHVAGIIAAEDDGFGIIGVAPEVDLFAIKVLDGAGFGMEEWIIAGIDWAIQNEIDVINLSIEGPHRQGLQDACERAYNAGILLVAAAGNSLVGGEPVAYPAAYDSVIAVTATDSTDIPELIAPIGEQLELAAPGVNVLSTISGGGYNIASGTSVAAPHVTGAAALYSLINTEDLNDDGLINNEDVRLLLQKTATDLGKVGKDETYGYGLVNASPLANHKTIQDRHHLLYGTVTQEQTDAPFETPGELFICFSCHEIDTCSNQIIIEKDCRVCHKQNRHHELYNTVIPVPTDAPYGTTGELFVCSTCHIIDSNTSDNQFPVEVERDCRVCHQPNKNKPVAVDDAYIMEDNSILYVSSPGLLHNDSDKDGHIITARLVSDVNFGILNLLPDGTFLYWPDPDFAGNDSFTYVACDGRYDSNIAKVKIVVDVDIKIVKIDIMPDLEQNSVNLCSTGVLPVAIIGSADCDVNEIDPSSLLLEEQVVPLQWRLENGTDNYQNLILEFDYESLNYMLRDLRIGQTHELWITGTLKDGTPIKGSDSIVIVSSSQLNEINDSNDLAIFTFELFPVPFIMNTQESQMEIIENDTQQGVE